MVPRPRNGISLCAGGGGLDMGLMLAEPGFHTRCFVEWEEYPRATIIAAQRAGYFAPAPIWDDLTAFDAKPFAGAIDTLLAGYPCQPFSQAGKRLGADDPRHLWPHVARVIRELGDGLRWVFLENVAGHITLGAETVLRELWKMGYTPAAGAFSAAETGAPHERLRWFCVAHRNSQNRGADSGQPNAGADWWNVTSRRSGELADPTGRGQRIVGDAAQPGRGGHADGGNVDLADAISSAGHQGGAGRRRSGPEPHGQAPDRASRHFVGIFPPGPGDRDTWAAVMASNPDRAPSFARRDVVAAAVNLAATLPPDEAEAIEPALRGIPRGAGMGAVVSQAPALVDQAQALTGLRNLADGMALRTRALRLLGNGVHPLAAANAWRALSAAHGLWPVDLATARRDCGAGPDGNGVVT